MVAAFTISSSATPRVGHFVAFVVGFSNVSLSAFVHIVSITALGGMAVMVPCDALTPTVAFGFTWTGGGLSHL